MHKFKIEIESFYLYIYIFLFTNNNNINITRYVFYVVPNIAYEALKYKKKII